MSCSFQKFNKAVALYRQDRIDEFEDFVVDNFGHEEYEELLKTIEKTEFEKSFSADVSYTSKKQRLANNVLNEFAFARKIYSDRVNNLIPQVVENYCLVLYAKENNIQTYKHWKTELLGHIKAIRGLNPKKGDKKKILRYELIEGFELDNPERVQDMIEYKFSQENIANDISQYCSKFSQNIDSLIDCLAGEISIDEFINSNNL